MDLALTVDVEARDHPCRGGNFRATVDTLARAGVPATLFVQGGWVEPRATEDEVAALGEQGMVVGLHGHTHRPFSELTGPEVADEMTRSEAALVAPEAVELLLDYASRHGDDFVTVLDVPRAEWEPPAPMIRRAARQDVMPKRSRPKPRIALPRRNL